MNAVCRLRGWRPHPGRDFMRAGRRRVVDDLYLLCPDWAGRTGAGRAGAVRDLREARRVAAGRLIEDQAAVAVDVWTQGGELFRVTRDDRLDPALPIPLRAERSSTEAQPPQLA